MMNGHTGGMMTKYTFCINGNYKMIEAATEQEAIRKAGIRKRDNYSLVETESLDDIPLRSTCHDGVLFES